MTIMNTYQAESSFLNSVTLPTHMPVIGWNTYNFTTPMMWNGTDNIVVMVCHQSLNNYYYTGGHEYTFKYDRVFAYQDDVSNVNGCSYISPWGANIWDVTLPNIRLNVISNCESNRVPVIATITTAPVITTDVISTTCVDRIIPVNITSPLNNYDVYEWEFSQQNSLFLDANGLIPYTGGNVTTIYVKNAVSGIQQLIANGTNTINGCASSDTFTINYVDEKPTVDLGGDINKCIDLGDLVFLNAGNPGNLFLWDNNYQGQVRVINTSGTYWVQVENSLGCIGYDTINVALKNNPISALGDDTVVCLNTLVTLNAGNDGISYYWNNGATNNVITTSQPGLYAVQIVGQNGCIKSDSVTIIQNGNSPAVTGIQPQNLASHTFKFSALNPTNVIGYKWNFGDGTPDVYMNSPTHTYTTHGNFLVTLWVSSSCGIREDTLTVHIYTTGVEDILNENAVNIYPNPTNGIFNIDYDKDNYQLLGIKVNNAIGQTIYQSKEKQINTVDLSNHSAGLYFIELITNKGIVKKKLTLIR